MPGDLKPEGLFLRGTLREPYENVTLHGWLAGGAREKIFHVIPKSRLFKRRNERERKKGRENCNCETIKRGENYFFNVRLFRLSRDLARTCLSRRCEGGP